MIYLISARTYPAHQDYQQVDLNFFHQWFVQQSVYQLDIETNVVEGQQLQGGKVVWDKTNLAGRKVASGIYIVLLANEDATQTATTKIAIIN